MIEREDGRVTVTLGDGDVLMGGTAWQTSQLARVWFAPKPDDYPHPLNEVVSVPVDRTTVPSDAAVVIVFLDRKGLDNLVTMLTRLRDKAFPVLPTTTPDDAKDGGS